METIRCPWCSVRVVPKTTGDCPSCSQSTTHADPVAVRYFRAEREAVWQDHLAKDTRSQMWSGLGIMCGGLLLLLLQLSVRIPAGRGYGVTIVTGGLLIAGTNRVLEAWLAWRSINRKNS